MRLILLGPRLFHGLLRVGISLGREDFRPRAPLRRHGGGYIYVIKSASGAKIGVTGNPEQRLSQLQAGSSSKIDYAYLAPASGDPRAIEREAHAMLASHRLTGEWFSTSPELAIAAVTGAAAKLGQSLTETRDGDAFGIVARAVIGIVKFIIAIPLVLLVISSAWLITVLWNR